MRTFLTLLLTFGFFSGCKCSVNNKHKNVKPVVNKSLSSIPNEKPITATPTKVEDPKEDTQKELERLRAINIELQNKLNQLPTTDPYGTGY